MTEIVQSSLFDYSQLDTETRIVVQQRTEEIKVLVRRSAQDIIDIGSKLIDVKARLGHGNFGGWLDSEFGWTDRTARQFMSVSEKFKTENFSVLEIGASALYLLASPSTPETARAEAIERAQSGEVISHKVAQGIVAYSKAAELPPNATRLTLAPPIAPSFLAPKPASTYVSPVTPVSGGEVVRSEVRYAPAPPIRDDEFDDMEEEAEEDGDGYDWSEANNYEQAMTPIITPTNKPHVAHNSGNNEWYTPKEYIEAARQVMGWIDLDPATSETANTVVQADEFYTAQDDGLAQEWTGKVWMNPPYSSDLVGRFAEKLCSHYEAGDVTEAIVLVNNATETGWFQRMAQTAMCVCFPRTRVKFWKPDGETGAPLQGQAILYFGTKKNDFVATFRPFGFVGVINGI